MLALKTHREAGRRVTLRGGFTALALRLQEAADSGDAIGSQAVCQRLSDCLRDSFSGSGKWGYYVDHFGDGESGDVIYSCSGDMMKAPYAMTTVGGKIACQIDMEQAVDVTPRTIYEEEAEDEDHYAAMEAARLYRSKDDFPLYERFISKAERKDAAAGSFAGKGKSFPILKPSDVMAAVRSMGRAGAENYSTDTLKSNIIRIAKAKGWTKELPKSWQGDGSKEAAQRQHGDIVLVESADTFSAEPIVLREAVGNATVPIRLINPGKGSTAFYTAEALKKAAADKVFPAGTHVYVNHATEAEEAARPEGDVNALAGVLAKDAEWRESYTHPKTGQEMGPGLYSDVKPFSDHANLFDEKGKFLGMSIRANGSALTESGKPVMREGVPVLASLSSAESVDVVTRAGRGGMILTEAARIPANSTQEVSDMDAAELKKLQESVTAQAALNTRLLERALRGDAREEASKILKTTTLVEAAKERVIEAVTRDFASIPQKDGVLDLAKFTEAVNAAAKTEGAYVASLMGSGRVMGMGVTAPPVVDVKEAEQRAAANKRLRESAIKSYMNLGLPEIAAKAAADKDLGEAA